MFSLTEEREYEIGTVTDLVSEAKRCADVESAQKLIALLPDSVRWTHKPVRVTVVEIE